MAKKVILATINETVLNIMSDYRVALYKEETVRNWFKKFKSGFESALEEYEEGTQDYNTILGYIHTLEADRTKKMTPIREDKQSCIDFMKKSASALYHAYVIGFREGDYNATGSVSIKKGRKETTYHVKVSAYDEMAALVNAMGMTIQSDNALVKFSDKIMLWATASATKNVRGITKGEQVAYIKEAGENKFYEYILLALFKAFEQNNAFDCHEDGSVTLHDFSAEA